MFICLFLPNSFRLQLQTRVCVCAVHVGHGNSLYKIRYAIQHLFKPKSVNQEQHLKSGTEYINLNAWDKLVEHFTRGLQKATKILNQETVGQSSQDI